MAKRNDYINKAELLSEVVKCRKVFLKAAAQLHRGINDPNTIRKIQNTFGNEQGGRFMSDKLGTMIYLMVTHIAQKYNFRMYTFREDFEGDALVHLCKSWWKFSPDFGSQPFSFYTTIIENQFKLFLVNEKKIREHRDDILEGQGLQASNTRQADNEQISEVKRRDMEEAMHGLRPTIEYTPNEFRKTFSKRVLAKKKTAKKKKKAQQGRKGTITL